MVFVLTCTKAKNINDIYDLYFKKILVKTLRVDGRHVAKSILKNYELLFPLLPLCTSTILVILINENSLY